MPLDDLRKKWGTIFMGEREATVEELDAMQEPARRAQVRQKVQEDYMERVREKATERARQILGEAYAERQKVLAEAREEAQRQSDLILAEVERIRQSTKEGYEAMQAELQKAADIRAEAQRIRDDAARIHESAQADGHAAGVESAEGELRAFRGELGQHLAWVLQALSAQFETIDAQWREDLAELKAAVGDKMKISGNVPPTTVLRNGTIDDVIESVKQCLIKGSDSPCGYSLAAGCDVPVGTPRENLEAYIYAARRYGRGAQKGKPCRGLIEEHLI